MILMGKFDDPLLRNGGAFLRLRPIYSSLKINYSARRLIGSLIIELDTCSNQKMLIILYLNSAQNT